MKRIAIFASGSGTNAQHIAGYFSNHNCIEVAMILSNKPDAYVLERAKRLNIKSFVFCFKALNETNDVINALQEEKIDFIVLAGFLLKIPDNILRAYPGRILNLHPALLPKYGGKGMYGLHVHEAVLRNGEKESGISIHYVNEHYDEGEIIFQAHCRVYGHDTPESLAARIHELEYQHYPQVIEALVLKQGC